MSNKIKKLPRDEQGHPLRHFTANGKKYIIRSATEGFSIERFNEYQILSLAVGFGATFQQMIEQLNTAISLANSAAVGKSTFIDLVLQLDAMKQGIVSAGNQRNTMALALCTLFIVTDDGDLTTWSEELANEKIADWNKEGYDAADFLLLALSSVAGFSEIYREVSAKSKTNPLNQQMVEFMGGTN